MSGTPQRTRDLTPQQLSELVMRRKQQRDAAAAATGDHGIVRRGATEAPLSFAQQRLWLLEEMDPAQRLVQSPAVFCAPRAR